MLCMYVCFFARVTVRLHNVVHVVHSARSPRARASAPRAAVARHLGEPRATLSDVADDVERPVDAADHADGVSITELVHRGTSTRGSIK